MALTKLDVLSDEEITERAQALEAASGTDVFVISSATNTGLKGVLGALFEIVRQRREQDALDRAAEKAAESGEVTKGWSPV